MHETLLARAAWPAPTVVLGMLLRPYSLGHELLLTRTANSLVDSPIGTAQDLCAAAWICCQSWRENQRAPFDWLAGLKLWIWRRRCRGANFDRELSNFVAYRVAGSLEFPISENFNPELNCPPRIPGSPFLLRLHQFLILVLRLTEDQAWDYPLGLAKCQWACYWEGESGLEVYNCTDEEFDRKVAAIREKIRTEGDKCPAS